MHLSLGRRSVGSALVFLCLFVGGCERDHGPAPIAETRQLIVDPARLTPIAGASGTVGARAFDAAGNPIRGAHLEFSPSDPRLLSVDAQGVVTSLGPAGQASILIANDLRSMTVPVDVVTGPARKLKAIGKSGLAIVAGTRPKEPVNVRLVDGFDNPIANLLVIFEAEISPSFSVSATTGIDGIASVTLPMVTREGHFVLNAHTSNDSSISLQLDIQVSAGPPATLDAIRVLPSGPVALVPDFELVLQVRDAFGNPVPNALVRWRTNSGSASFDPPQSLSGPDGLVRTRWQLTKLKGRRATLRAVVVRHEAASFQTWIALEH